MGQAAWGGGNRERWANRSALCFKRGFDGVKPLNQRRAQACEANAVGRGLRTSADGLDHPAAKLLLQGAHLLPYGRLGEAKLTRCRGEAAKPDDRLQSAELLQPKFLKVVSGGHDPLEQRLYTPNGWLESML